MQSIFNFIFTTALLFSGAMLNAQADVVVAKGSWNSSRSDNGTRTLSYSAPVTLQGKLTKFSVRFFCNAFSSKTESGALGLDLNIDGVKKLTSFHFDDFDGPDAPAAAKKLLKVTLTRTNKSPDTFISAVNGGYPELSQFNFNFSDLSKVKTSLAKTLLKSLAEGADNLQLVVTDYRDANVRLEFNIPLAGKHADFKTLIKELN